LVFRTGFNWDFTGESPDSGCNKNHSVQHDKDKSKYSVTLFLSLCIHYNYDYSLNHLNFSSAKNLIKYGGKIQIRIVTILHDWNVMFVLLFNGWIIRAILNEIEDKQCSTFRSKLFAGLITLIYLWKVTTKYKMRAWEKNEFRWERKIRARKCFKELKNFYWILFVRTRNKF
jgi:hypothetical protein